ncbi:hypothetical protein ACR820_33295 [Streptomyces netropsis]
MRSQLLRRGVRTAAVAAIAFATTVGGASGATAQRHGTSPIDVTVNASGIKAPHHHEGGRVAFRVSTDAKDGRQLQVVRPHKGVPIRRVLRDLADAVSHTPSRAAAGMRAFEADAEAVGGAFVTRKVHEEFTTSIPDGTVYLIDFTAFLERPTKPVVKSLKLYGSHDGHHKELTRSPHSTVTFRDTDAGPRFRTEGLVTSHKPILIRNASSEVHEAQLQRVTAGTTHRDLRQYFDAMAQGKKAKSPFTGQPVGFGGISPGHKALLRIHGLKPGTYALTCYVPDEHSGLPHVFMGMYKIVHLR